MARINLSLPDDLKARMDDLGNVVNWSTVAQRAFEAQVTQLTDTRRKPMSSVIDRLKASKAKQVDDVAARGFRAGRKWAEEHAEYLELKAIDEQVWHNVPTEDLVTKLHGVLGGSDFWQQVDVSVEDQSQFGRIPIDYFVEGFIKGARAVWEQVGSTL